MQHVPVALDRCIALLAPAIERAIAEKKSAYVIDATLGLAGHTSELLSRYPELTVIGLDRDLAAIEIARTVLHNLALASLSFMPYTARLLKS